MSERRRDRRSRRLRILVLACWSSLAASTSSLEAQSLKLEEVGTIAERADVVRVGGPYVYLGAGPKFSVIDITDVAKPKPRGSVTLPETVTAIAVSGSVAYVAAGLSGLSIIDVSNPDAPRVAGSFKTPGEALRVGISGTKAVVTNRMSGLEVLDVSNIAKPVSVGSFYTDGYARDVAILGSLAFLVDSTTDFFIIDVSKPGLPNLSTQTVEGGTDNVVVAPSPRGTNTAYVMGRGAIQVYDISNPAAPAKVTTYKMPARIPGCGAPPCAALAVQGSLAYIAASSDGVQVIDLSDATNPRLAGSYKTAGPARDVAVADSLVFVAVGDARPVEAGKPPVRGSVVILRRSP
jgi:hypothetical protein